LAYGLSCWGLVHVVRFVRFVSVVSVISVIQLVIPDAVVNHHIILTPFDDGILPRFTPLLP
jgi:hypothetical protein